MAVAGSATTAYTMQMRNGVLQIKHTTRLMSLCDKPDDAIAKIQRGDEATVAGGDAYAVRVALTGKTDRGEVQP